MPERIPGGYYIKARVIKNKKIHFMPPHVREIWDYCLREANYADSIYGPYTIKRGQLFRSYSDIREDLCWFIGYRKMMYDENQTKKAMKALREHDMILTKREPGGVLITVLKYDFYQDPNNYERTNESTSDDTTKELLKHYGSTTNNKKVKKEEELEERKVSLLESLKKGILRMDQYLLEFSEPKLREDAIEVIELMRKTKNPNSRLLPDRVEIEKLIQNWLFPDGVSKDDLLKMISGAGTDDFEKDNLQVTYLLNPIHRAKLLMKEEANKGNKSQNDTESKNIGDHQKTLDQEKQENLEYQLATLDEKIKIISELMPKNGPHKTISRDELQKKELQKRIVEYVRSNKTDRSTIMMVISSITNTYLEELSE